MDLLISTLRPKLVGTLEDDNLLAAVGNDPYNLECPGSLTVSVELYQLQGEAMSLPDGYFHHRACGVNDS